MNSKKIICTVFSPGIFLLALCFILFPLHQNQHVASYKNLHEKADLIVFSFNRPLQLFAFLESVELYVSGLDEIYVIYRVSDHEYMHAYDEVHKTFPYVKFIKEDEYPGQDFKSLTLQTFCSSPCTYIVFAVDDIIVKDVICISEAIQVLQETGAYGFFFRLGKNLSECYSLGCLQKVPPCKHIKDDIYSWYFKDGESDWRYPYTLDMTLYKKSDIEHDIKKLSFSSPNLLEGEWSTRIVEVLNRLSLFYEFSKIVNLPLNRVQNYYPNRYMNFLSPLDLLIVFNSSLKIDIKPLFRVDNKAAHMEYEPTFIKR